MVLLWFMNAKRQCFGSLIVVSLSTTITRFSTLQHPRLRDVVKQNSPDRLINGFMLRRWLSLQGYHRRSFPCFISHMLQPIVVDKAEIVRKHNWIDFETVADFRCLIHR